MIDNIPSSDVFTQTQNKIIDEQYNAPTQSAPEKINENNFFFGNSLSIGKTDNSEVFIDFNQPGSEKESTKNIAKSIINNVLEMDSNYKKSIERISDWPSFKNYIDTTQAPSDKNIEKSIGITHISNIKDTPDVEEKLSIENYLKKESERMESLRNIESSHYSAGLKYSQDTARWYIGTQFWLSKIKLLTSAVSQVNTGLKTLFTSQ